MIKACPPAPESKPVCLVCHNDPAHPLFHGMCEECWSEHSSYPSSPKVFRREQSMPPTAWQELCWGDVG